MDDLISRQWLMECVNEGWIKFDTEKDENTFIHLVRDIAPSAQPERLTDDDFETIRIHLNAYKEKLCNQQRWEEAEEYQRIIDRFMAFASAQTENEERKEESAQNVLKDDSVSRKAAIDAVNGVIADYIPTLYGRYEALPLEMAKAIKRLPTAEPTLYGYNIKHLAFVATVMEKEGVTAEYAVRTFGDMSRALRMLIEELQEKVEKSLSAMQLPVVRKQKEEENR